MILETCQRIAQPKGDNMPRDNGGVARKVTSFANAGDSGGQAGSTRDMGGAPNQMSANPKEVDQSKQRGIYPSIQAPQSTKDFGGVGDNKGSNGPANDFRQPHP